MSPDFVLLLVFLAALVVVGARLGFSGDRDLPPRLRALTETGTPFIVIGAVVGPQVLNLLSAHFIDELNSLLILGFGGIGFLYGSHFEWRRMKRFPVKMYWAGLTESLLTLSVVAFASWVVIPLLHADVPAPLRLALALSLGICAAGTAPAGVFLLQSAQRVRRADLQVLRFFAAVDDLPALVALGVLFAVIQPYLDAETPLSGWQRLLLGVAVGITLGAVTHWLFPQTGDVRHNSLILFGMAALGAGAAAVVHISPLFVSGIGGAVFANLCPRKEDAYGLMASREHTLYATFLLIAGAMFRFEGTRVLWILVPLYVFVRGVAKISGGLMGRALFLRNTRISRMVGAGLLFQGGMPLVMAVHVEHSLGSPLTYLVMTTFVLAVFINDMFANSLATSMLRRSSHPSPRTGEPPPRV